MFPVVSRADPPSCSPIRQAFTGGIPPTTVLVDGVDPFADASAPVGLSCRVFRTPDGLRGAPTVEQLVRVLR